MPPSPPKGSPVPLNAPLSPGLTLKGWVTYWIERQVTICPQVPPKGSPVPLNVPLSPGLTLKGWATYWIERQVTICPQGPPKGSPVPLHVPLSPGLTLKGWVPHWKFCGSGANVTPFGSGANVTLFQGRMWPPSLSLPEGTVDHSNCWKMIAGSHKGEGTCYDMLPFCSPIWSVQAQPRVRGLKWTRWELISRLHP